MKTTHDEFNKRNPKLMADANLELYLEELLYVLNPKNQKRRKITQSDINKEIKLCKKVLKEWQKVTWNLS